MPLRCLIFLISLFFFSLKCDAAKYFITSSYYTKVNAYVYNGSSDNLMFYIRMNISSTNGGNVPVTINDLSVDLSGSTNLADISDCKVWYSGTSFFFSSAVLVSTITNPITPVITFNALNQNISSTGVHNFWITCSVNNAAVVNNYIDAFVPANGMTVTDYTGTNAYNSGTSTLGNKLTVLCGSSSYSPPPTPVLPALNQFTKPTIGGGGNYNSLHLKPDGTVWVSGYNNSGQFGDGTVSGTYSNNQWLQVVDPNIYNIVQIDVGWQTNFALRQDGTAWGWGDNWNGKIGNGTSSSNQPTPAQVIKANGSPLLNIVKVMTGMYMSVALTSDHHVYAWGKNSGGAFGPGYTANIDYNRAQLLYDGPNPIDWAIDVEVGDAHIVMLRWDGTVWAMGSNSWGTLGNGSNISSGLPVPAINSNGNCNTILSNIVEISTGHRNSLALDNAGNVYGWGWNNYAQAANNNPGVYQFFPMHALGTSCSGNLTNIVQIELSHNNGFAIDASNNLYSWGSDQSGQLANGYPPTQNLYCPTFVSSNATEVAGGLSNMLFWNTSGDLCAAGFNWYGQLGIGGPYGCCGYEHTPVCISIGPLPVELISFTGYENGRSNVLKWSTASETNNDYFIVEYSKDGNLFNTAGIVEGAGNSNVILDYNFTHFDVEADVTYYRLKQVDFDGAIEYSNLISVVNKISPSSSSVWALVNSSNIEINLADLRIGSEYHLQIVDARGMTLFKKVLTASDKSTKVQVSRDLIGQGIFFVKFYNNYESIPSLKIFVP